MYEANLGSPQGEHAWRGVSTDLLGSEPREQIKLGGNTEHLHNTTNKSDIRGINSAYSEAGWRDPEPRF